MEATIQVLVELGYAKATTTKIAARAGVSVGSLYQYFPSKDALIRALLERTFAAVHGRLLQAVARSAGRPLDETVHAMITELLHAKAAQPELGVVLAEQLPSFDGLDHKRASLEAILETIRPLLAAHRDEIEVENIDLAAYVVVNAVEGVITAAVRDGRGRIDDPALVAELVRLVLQYLRGASVAGRATGRARAAPRR